MAASLSRGEKGAKEDLPLSSVEAPLQGFLALPAAGNASLLAFRNHKEQTGVGASLDRQALSHSHFHLCPASLAKSLPVPNTYLLLHPELGWGHWTRNKTWPWTSHLSTSSLFPTIKGPRKAEEDKIFSTLLGRRSNSNHSFIHSVISTDAFWTHYLWNATEQQSPTQPRGFLGVLRLVRHPWGLHLLLGTRLCGLPIR